MAVTLAGPSANETVPASVQGEGVVHPILSRPGLARTFKPTVTGMDVRLTLQRALDSGRIALTLTTDPDIALVKAPDGLVRGTRTVSTHSTDGSPYSYAESEYVLGAPIVRDSGGDARASDFTAQTMLALGPPIAGREVLLTVDPQWLSDPARVYPIHIDLPITTAASALYSRRFASVSSCAPGLPGPLARVVVGVQGSCTYRGQLAFDTRSLAATYPVTQIQSATLNLYAVDQLGAAGVQILPNAPVASGSPAAGSSWDTAPAASIGSTAIPSSGADGH